MPPMFSFNLGKARLPAPQISGPGILRGVGPGGRGAGVVQPIPSGGGIGPSVGFPLQQFGAGQGPTPSTGQAADNPFQNTFNFQIPQPAGNMATGDSGSTTGASSGSGGVTSYLPLIIIGVITAGIAYYAFERKKK